MSRQSTAPVLRQTDWRTSRMRQKPVHIPPATRASPRPNVRTARIGESPSQPPPSLAARGRFSQSLVYIIQEPSCTCRLSSHGSKRRLGLKVSQQVSLDDRAWLNRSATAKSWPNSSRNDDFSACPTETMMDGAAHSSPSCQNRQFDTVHFTSIFMFHPSQWISHVVWGVWPGYHPKSDLQAFHFNAFAAKMRRSKLFGSGRLTCRLQGV